MNRLIGLFCLLLGVAVASASADARKYRINVRGWTGGSYVSKETGRFSHCVVSSRYKRGDNLLFSINNKYTFSVSIFDQSFNLRKGDKFKAIMHVDFGPEFTRKAVAVNQNQVVIPVNDRVKFFQMVRRGRILRIYIDDLELERAYSLKGTSRALNATLRCVKVQLRNQPEVEEVEADQPAGDTAPAGRGGPKNEIIEAEGDNNTGPEPKTRTASLPPANPPAVKQTGIPVSKALIYSINLLSSAGVTGYTILEDNPFKDSGYLTSWKYSKGKFGAFSAFKQTKANFLDVQTAKILGDDARDCKGQFASGFRISDKKPDWSGRRLFTVCSNSTDNNDFTINYSIGRQANGTAIVVATMVSGSAPVGDGAENGDDSEQIDKAIYESSYFRKLGR